MWIEHDKMLQNQNTITYLLNFLTSTKGLCWGGFWKPWGWWKSRRWLCRHLRRKKMEEIKASNGNLHLCMPPTQRQKTWISRTKRHYLTFVYVNHVQSTSSKDLQSYPMSYVNIPSSNRNMVSRSLYIFAETKLSAHFKHYMHHISASSAPTRVGMHQHAPSCTNMKALLAESASALGRALPGHCIPLGVEVSFGKGLSWTAATKTQI